MDNNSVFNSTLQLTFMLGIEENYLVGFKCMEELKEEIKAEKLTQNSEKDVKIKKKSLKHSSEDVTE